MNIDQRVKAFANFRTHLQNLPPREIQTLADQARNENPWFVEASVSMAFEGIITILSPTSFDQWAHRYKLPSASKTIGLVLAGNIPMVGFHDVLCTLVAGHRAMIKLSSKDSVLIRYLLRTLTEIEPAFADRIEFADRLKDFDAIIATGSDNTSRYFEYYFAKYPHIIRKNRTSVAILTGDETTEDLRLLARDVFSYFGLGCRNVSKLYVPQGYQFNDLLQTWTAYENIVHHHKYCNNYDYQKSILLVNRQPFLDSGFVILQESDKLVSPISVIFYEHYADSKALNERLSEQSDKIQVVVGKSSPHKYFGDAQYPAVDDYADGVDTMKFLCSL